MGAVLRELGREVVTAERAQREARRRRRDAERLELQVAGGIYAGSGLLQKNMPVPTPLSTPRRTGRGINEETQDLLRREDEAKADGES